LWWQARPCWQGMAKVEVKPDWVCKSCKGADGTRFRNFGFRKQCKKCKLSKGHCFGGNANTGGDPALHKSSELGTGGSSRAMGALRQQDANKVKALQDKLRKAEAEATRLKERLEKQDATKSAVADVAEAVDVSAPASDTGELDAAVARARDKLKSLKELPVELHGLVAGGFEVCCANLQQELAEAQATRRSANPLKKQLEGAEAHKARMDKKVADDKAALQLLHDQLADVQKQMEKRKATLQESEAAAAKAAQEVASLATLFASERTAPATEVPPACGHGQPPPGYVAVAFAEEKWAEREAAFSQQLAQLQALVATSPEPAPSEAEEEDTMETVHDDDAWSKVEPAKRKALLGRQRDILAKKVRANLGKVSTIASPVNKS
jgi:hypothetical protein